MAELVLPPGVQHPIPREQVKLPRVWTVKFLYQQVRPLDPEEREKLYEELPGVVITGYHAEGQSLGLRLQVNDEEPMHLVLGYWTLQIQEFMAKTFGFSANNMVEAMIVRRLEPEQEAGLRKLNKKRKKGKR